jgi:ferredoxin
MRLVVDADRCEGHGLCEQIAPEVFALDDTDTSRVLHDVPPERLMPAAEAAVRICPVAALRIER